MVDHPPHSASTRRAILQVGVGTVVMCLSTIVLLFLAIRSVVGAMFVPIHHRYLSTALGDDDDDDDDGEGDQKPFYMDFRNMLNENSLGALGMAVGLGSAYVICIVFIYSLVKTTEPAPGASPST